MTRPTSNENSLDALFSPERLCRNWRKTRLKGAEVPAEETVADENAQACYQTLRRLINRRFSGDDAEVLNRFLDELGPLLEQASSEDVAQPIDEVLNIIEDLVEAFEIGGRGQVQA